MIYTVTEDWIATYSDPITLTAKEQVELTDRQDNWDGHIWIWAKSAVGLEGWIPDSLVEEVNGSHRAREDYTAMELNCQAGARYKRNTRLGVMSVVRRANWLGATEEPEAAKRLIFFDIGTFFQKRAFLEGASGSGVRTLKPLFGRKN